jgi:transcription termination factor Rho
VTAGDASAKRAPDAEGDTTGATGETGGEAGGEGEAKPKSRRKRERKPRERGEGRQSRDRKDGRKPRERKESREPRERKEPREPLEKIALSGILELRKDGSGFLRDPKKDLKVLVDDPKVSQQMARRLGLKTGMLVEGSGTRDPRDPGPKLESVELVDGEPESEKRSRRGFKNLTVIDPDFHYELGCHEQENTLSMRIVDLLCPLGRGQRGLLVAPPRTGKTTLLMAVANSMQALYPDVHLIVLLVDERPEEATYWKRGVENGEVFVSTMDESPTNHVRLVELVQARAERLVEAGKEVVILLDSITRMTRAFNNIIGGKNARTMSGGLDAKVFQRPKHFFGAARNTEDGGSLTILATALVDTGSRMDQVIYEEFKGTGNMELTLDRRLADRRVYPAVSIEQTATRKEEKLLSRTTLRKVNILRRVLSRMRPREAMEMLVDRLGRYPSNQEFLGAFSMDDVE